MRCIGLTVALLLASGMVFAQNTTGVCASDGAEDGFVSLFDGKTFKGWQGNMKGYTIKDGTMIATTNKPGGTIFTDKEYANFVLRFEFKLPPGGNNGVAIRTPLEGKKRSSYRGMEIQILDDAHPKYKDLKPWQFHGSIYGVVPPDKRASLKPAGEWNFEELVADGSRIKVTVNGAVVVDADIKDIKETLDGREHPGLHNAKGRIGWAGHGDPVAFRNIRLKELP